jgi:putative nucleotidyltransferase with HDIG domain
MDEFQIRLRQPLLVRIIELLPTGVPIYLVGGAIRDALLNRPNYDLDFVTPGDAMKLARNLANDLGAAFFPLDTERNIARFIFRRTDQLDIQGRNSIRVDFSTYQGTDLINDLRGRDFTINAMAVEIHNLKDLIDPLGGAVDLISKRLRTCSESSFIHDPVRILRAVRFSVELALSIPSETKQLIHQAVDLLPEVSAERLRDELFRILTQSNPATSLRILDRFNVLQRVFPEVCMLKTIQQSPPHVMDVWEHTLDLISRLEDLLEVLSPDYDFDRANNLMLGLLTLRLGRYREQFKEHFENTLNPDRPHRGLLFLAGLYHDVGKLKTQSMDENGKIRFLEHEHIGSKIAENRGIELRLSNLEIERLVKIINLHMRPSLLSHGNEIPSKKAVYRFFRAAGSAGVDICILSLADILATYGPTLPPERWSRHLDVVRILLSAWWEDKDEIVFPQPLINGDRLMAELDLSPGPMVGYLLETIREAQVGDEIKTVEEAIELADTILRDNLNKKTGGLELPV